MPSCTPGIPLDRFGALKAALLEASLGCSWSLREDEDGRFSLVSQGRTERDMALWWKANEMIYGSNGHACWPCVREQYQDDQIMPGASDVGYRCSRGSCSHPGERRHPPTQLLRGIHDEQDRDRATRADDRVPAACTDDDNVGNRRF